MAGPQVANGGNALQLRLHNPGGPTRNGPPVWELSVALTALHRKNKPMTRRDSLNRRPKLRNMDIKFGTWNVRTFYITRSLMTVSKELAR